MTGGGSFEISNGILFIIGFAANTPQRSRRSQKQ